MSDAGGIPVVHGREEVKKHFVEFRIPIQVRAEDDEFVFWYEVPEGWVS